MHYPTKKDFMAQVNELMANSQNAGVPMDMTTAIKKVYQGLGYIKQTERREAVRSFNRGAAKVF